MDTESIIRRFVSELEASIRQELMSRVMGALGGAAPSPKAKRSAPLPRAAAKRHIPTHCLKCDKPHKGPRWSFLCDDHKDTTPEPERKALLAQWKHGNEPPKVEAPALPSPAPGAPAEASAAPTPTVRKRRR